MYRVYRQDVLVMETLYRDLAKRKFDEIVNEDPDPDRTSRNFPSAKMTCNGATWLEYYPGVSGW